MTQPLGGWTGEGGWVGAVGYLSMLGVAGLLERVQYRLKRDESRTWWVSNGRDVLNAVALGAVSVGLWMYGFRGPLVVCVAGTVVLLLSVSQMRLESRPRSTLWSMVAALVLGTPALVAPAWVARTVGGAVGALVP
jgi:hypothetical protein